MELEWVSRTDEPQIRCEMAAIPTPATSVEKPVSLIVSFKTNTGELGAKRDVT